MYDINLWEKQKKLRNKSYITRGEVKKKKSPPSKRKINNDFVMM